MENGEKSAFTGIVNEAVQHGLTKREYFAGLAMQGMLANIDQSYSEPFLEAHRELYFKKQQQLINDVAIKSVEYSDALLKELDKHKSE